MGEVYYIKKNGKYIPSNDPYALDGLTNGSWLVTIAPGHTSCRNFIKPKFAELDAALHYLKEGLSDAMLRASEARPKSVKMSEKEQKAWKAYKRIMGKDIPCYLQFCSIGEIADKGCAYLRKAITENNYDIKKIEKKYSVKKRVVNNSINELEV